MPIDAELKSAIDALGNEHKNAVNGLVAKYDSLQTKTAEMQRQLDAVDIKMQGRPDPGDGGGGFYGYETPGARFIKSPDLETAKKTSNFRFALDRGFHPAFESKTLIDSAALGYSHARYSRGGTGLR